MTSSVQVTYPNREHQNSDRRARTRALKAIADATDSLALIRRGLEAGHLPHSPSAESVAADVMKLAAALQVLETLADVREWHAADMAEKEEG